ncbi:MAG: hypothetical protein D0531_08375 [Methylococcales bacterium]|nr:MAG: hypothetical protein D0531_08375 [Methylococcales bacterium]
MVFNTLVIAKVKNVSPVGHRYYLHKFLIGVETIKITVGATDSPSNPMFQDTGRICRPYKSVTLGSQGWNEEVFEVNEIVFDDYEKYFHSL